MSRLRCYFNWLGLDGLDQDGQKLFSNPYDAVTIIEAAGYDGIQFIDPPDPVGLAEARSWGLGVCGCGRVNAPGEAGPIAEAAAEAGLECLTLHVGWGMESDDEGARLIEAVLEASARWRIPLYVETHRATLFQDLQRTVQFVRRFPELRFNGDFSHWYTGSEMVYGGFEKKLAYIQPVVERVRFVHGRIGNPGCMQLAIAKDDAATYVGHFREMWTRCFAAYLQVAAPQQAFLTFAVELLAPEIFYARTFQGKEESDRWAQSLLLVEIARECFAEAERSLQD